MRSMRKSCCCQPSLLSPLDADAGEARSDLARDNHHSQQQGHQHKLTQHCLHRHARFPAQILTVGDKPCRRAPQSEAKPPRMGTGLAAPCRNRLISEATIEALPSRQPPRRLFLHPPRKAFSGSRVSAGHRGCRCAGPSPLGRPGPGAQAQGRDPEP